MPQTSNSSQKKVVHFVEIQKQSYNLKVLLDAIEIFTFKKKQTDQILSNPDIQIFQPKHYFYQAKSEFNIQSKNIIMELDKVKKQIGQRVWNNFQTIKQEIISNSLNVSNLRYLYGIMKMFSVDQTYIARILTWIYALITQKIFNQSKILGQIIIQEKKLLINLGLAILLSGKKSTQFQIEKSQISQRKVQKKFKQIMKEFIKNQQKKNHQDLYQICRICEAHICINLMHAHLSFCKVVHQKGYFQTKIIQKGKQILQKIRFQHLEMMDPLDDKADLQLIFNRVFSTLGDKNVLFDIKEDISQIQEIIDQFKDNRQILIRELAGLLQEYHTVIIKKLQTGYESQGDIQSSKKINPNRRNSRGSIKFSSNSIKTGSEKAISLTGSQKNIRYDDSLPSYTTTYRLKDFQILKILGKGAYSQVYLVRKINTQDLFAMKVVQVQSVDGDTLEAFKKQQEIYKTINSQMTVRLYCSFSEQNLHFFILDYANGGNLRTLLQEECYLSQKDAQFYIANLILGLESLHQLGIIHRDMKPQNVVIDQNGFLKLTDFNLAFLLTGVNQQSNQTEKFFGSPDYIAPQVIKSQLKDHPSRDIWSLGIMAYQMMIGVTPFTAMDIQQVFQNILKGEIEWPQIGQQEGMISQKTKNFIQRLLQPNPKLRLGYGGIHELKNDQFFDNFPWQNMKSIHPFYVPTKQSLKLIQDKSLKQAINNRKSSKNNHQIPSLDCIIRYDILKSKTSLKAKSTRLSRFRIQKDLAQLKRLTSMDNFQVDQCNNHSTYNQRELDLCSSQSSEANKASVQQIGTFNNISQTSEEGNSTFSIRISSPGQKVNRQTQQ